MNDILQLLLFLGIVGFLVWGVKYKGFKKIRKKIGRS